MNAVDFVHFLAYLLLAGTLIRTIELVFHGSAVSQALGVIY